MSALYEETARGTGRVTCLLRASRDVVDVSRLFVATLAEVWQQNFAGSSAPCLVSYSPVSRDEVFDCHSDVYFARSSSGGTDFNLSDDEF
jgi:hypothetical protein